jgi:type I restriction enzyme R subunit
MVKHAADEQNPLLTASERVERAFQKVTAGQTFIPEEQQWLDRIREHLRENLSIDKDDFEELPIFNRYGGWGKVYQVLGPTLPELIKQLNREIAA